MTDEEDGGRVRTDGRWRTDVAAAADAEGTLVERPASTILRYLLAIDFVAPQPPD